MKTYFRLSMILVVIPLMAACGEGKIPTESNAPITPQVTFSPSPSHTIQPTPEPTHAPTATMTPVTARLNEKLPDELPAEISDEMVYTEVFFSLIEKREIWEKYQSETEDPPYLKGYYGTR